MLWKNKIEKKRKKKETRLGRPTPVSRGRGAASSCCRPATYPSPGTASTRHALAGSPRRAPTPSAAEPPRSCPGDTPDGGEGKGEAEGWGQLTGHPSAADGGDDISCDPPAVALEFGMGGERVRSRFQICPRLWRRWSVLRDRPAAEVAFWLQSRVRPKAVIRYRNLPLSSHCYQVIIEVIVAEESSLKKY
jgi:hypothetical protein